MENYFRRIVRANSEDMEAKARQLLIEKFLEQYSIEVEPNEKHRGNREMKLIDLANKELQYFFGRFGLQVAQVPPEIIHFYNQQNYKGADYREGAVETDKVRITILDDASDIPTFLRITHEMAHMVSAKAFQLRCLKYASEILPYRLGLTVVNFDRDAVHLTNTNEAITEEITIAIFRKLVHQNQFKEELSQSIVDEKKFREMLDTPPIPKETIFSRLDSRSGRLDVYFHSYKEQRAAFQELVSTLASRSPVSEGEIFEMFIRAYISGNLLSIARAIEQALGRGSWKRFVEAEKDPQTLIDFLNTFKTSS